jgi:hypothetical protein
MVIGLAIYQSTILDIPFPSALYKKLLGQQPTFEDFLALQPSLGRGLQQMLAFDGSVQVWPRSPSLDDSSLTFFLLFAGCVLPRFRCRS